MSTTAGWLTKLKNLLAKIEGKTTSRVEIVYDIGFGNTLYIRGEGGGLNWETGLPMKNMAPDVWVWETDHPFDVCSFKVLINDVQYESGENHFLVHGGTIRHTPVF